MKYDQVSLILVKMVMAQELSGHVIPNTSAGNMVLP